jgi:cell division protein FtsI (penicillin-binding protein 3)
VTRSRKPARGAPATPAPKAPRGTKTSAPTPSADPAAAPPPAIRGWRAGVVTLVLCGLFGGVIARAHHLQVHRADDLGREALEQVGATVRIQARRGAIYDRHGRELAVSVAAESLFARPRQVTAPREAAAALAPLLGQTELALYERLTSERPFVFLGRRVSPHLAAQVRDLGFAGIDSMAEWQRFYPMRHVAGLLLGFTGDDGIGLEGIERALDSVLSGGTMEVRGLRDARGRPILTTESPELEAMEGASIVLTIDSRIQRIAERELERAVTEREAKTGVVVIVHPATGEVLAMTSWPAFDPNRFRTLTPADWRNRAVTDCWEPGSTMKVFTYAAALERGVVQPEDVFDTGGGRASVGRHTIRDVSRRGQLSAHQIMQISSNIGTYRIGQRVGDRGLYQAFRDFGFGQLTGTGLGGEQAGMLAGPPWAEIELANRAFGQGVSATPLQVAMGYAALANNGVLMAPQLVREVRDKNGAALERFEPREVRRVVSARTARRVIDSLEAATEPPGTGVRARIPGIRVAGKTGTAQKVNPDTGLYDDLWMAGFVGIVPADAPELVIVVMIDEPGIGHYGGEVAAPVFARIAEQALAVRGIFTDSPESDPPATSAQRPRAHAAGGPSPDGEPAASEHPEVGLATDYGDDDHRTARVLVPDLTGRDLARALAATEPLGLVLDATGWGLVQRQWPGPGASVLQGSGVEVFLTPPYDLDGLEPTAHGLAPQGAATAQRERRR